MTTLQRDHGFPLIEAARKTDRRGQIDSVNTWLRKGQLLIPNVSSVAEDMLKSIWNAGEAQGRHLGEYSPTWHPDPAEALRYCATGIYSTWFKAKVWESKKQECGSAPRSAALKTEMTPSVGLRPGLTETSRWTTFRQKIRPRSAVEGSADGDTGRL